MGAGHAACRDSAEHVPERGAHDGDEHGTDAEPEAEVAHRQRPGDVNQRHRRKHESGVVNSVFAQVEGDISTLRIWVTFQLWVYTK